MSLSARLKRIGVVRTAAHRLRTLYAQEFAFPAGHYYSPLPSVKELKAREASIWGDSPQALPGIDTNVAGQLILLARLASYGSASPFPALPDIGYE